jgi:LacI family transcriptional regulator
MAHAKTASPTLNDIAKICEVDVSTVSRGLRDDPRVTQQTKDRISEAAKRLGYSPNLAARMLRASRSKFLWFIAPDLGNPVDNTMVEEAALAAAIEDYDVLVSLHLGKQKVFDRILRSLSSGLAAGAIINRRDINDLSVLQALHARNLPVVLIDVPVEALQLTTITTDHAKSTDALVEACAQAGAKFFIVLFERDLNLVDRRRFEFATVSLTERRIPFAIAEPGQPLAAELPPDTTVAILCSHQSVIQSFMQNQLVRFKRNNWILGCYDQWIGSILPAKKAFIAIQNCKEIAKAAVDRILSIISQTEPAHSSPKEISLPLLRIDRLD